MSTEQENLPPVNTRLPRLATPTKSAASRGIPLPTTHVPRAAPLGTATTVSNGKRKTPVSSAAPPAKRVASNSLSKSASTISRPATRSSLGRKTTDDELVTRSTMGVSTRRTSAESNSSGATSSSTRTTRKPPVPPRSAAPTRAAAAPRTTAPARTTAARIPAPKKVAAPPPVTKPRAALAGGASRATAHPARRTAGTKTPETDRMERMESMLELLKEETAKISSNQKSLDDRQSQARAAEVKELESRRILSGASEEMREMRDRHLQEVDELERQLMRKEREKANLEIELKDLDEKLHEKAEEARRYKAQMCENDTRHVQVAAELSAAKMHNNALQAEVERATIAVSAMKAELQEAKNKALQDVEDAEQRVLDARAECDARVAAVEAELRSAETLRRKLHNQIQELKGNIRVFARVRPALPHELGNPEGLAAMNFGDERVAAETGQSHLSVVSKSESAMGKEREQVNQFTFDKVFQPKHGQQEVFEEISMLAQSVLDGYNVCIFAYGQTGSGKSWTMEGGESPKDAGMIPRAIDMIFDVSNQLKDRGWKYQMEGSFLEVYNDVINDLLGTCQFDTKKHEIKIDKDNHMTVTDTVSLPLSNSRQVSVLLERARGRRAVAATLMNERSSRSHSVFALKVKGFNSETGESCEGTLNLVDLAGSERLATSGAGENKDRLKETININKSLSALADVIGALGSGQQGGHVPYRNSTLTRLLQTSLSGSSKTLMLCNLSPLAAHLGETVCTLRFATKVNSTPAGTARRSVGKA